MTIRPMIYVPVTTCPDCLTAYDARELEGLEQIEPEKPTLERYRCPVCGGLVSVDAELRQQSRDLAMDPAEYERAFPHREPRPRVLMHEDHTPATALERWIYERAPRQMVALALAVALIAMVLTQGGMSWVLQNW